MTAAALYDLRPLSGGGGRAGNQGMFTPADILSTNRRVLKVESNSFQFLVFSFQLICQGVEHLADFGNALFKQQAIFGADVVQALCDDALGVQLS